MSEEIKLIEELKETAGRSLKSIAENAKLSIAPKSFEDIRRDIVATLSEHLGPHFDIEPNSEVRHLIETFASESAKQHYLYTFQGFPNLYYYPDGTLSANKPTDGQIFVKFVDTVPEKWMWDDLITQWYKVASNPGDFVDSPNQVKPNEKGCECGAEHTSTPQLHLSFCRLWSPRT